MPQPESEARRTKREQRSHYDRHGKAKQTYSSMAAAQEQVDYLNTWKPRPWHHASEAYECWLCGLFHIGGRRFGEHITRRQTLMVEIGTRAYRELVFENRRRRGYKRILGRYYKGRPEDLKQLYLDEAMT